MYLGMLQYLFVYTYVSFPMKVISACTFLQIDLCLLILVQERNNSTTVIVMSMA